jgi:hypothetical protein
MYCDIFEYLDGELYWKTDRGVNRLAGIQVLGKVNHRGYRYVQISGKKVPLHRVIWEMHFGTAPPGLTVDHIDRCRSNNRIENLRLATSTQQNANTGKYNSHGKHRSKWKGLSSWKGGRGWRLFFKGEYQGLFECPYDAATVYNFYAATEFGEFASYNTTEQPWLLSR